MEQKKEYWLFFVDTVYRFTYHQLRKVRRERDFIPN